MSRSMLKEFSIKHFWLILTVLAVLIFLVGSFGEVLLSPDSYCVRPSGDGVKNYFTVSYQVKHGTDYLNFKGLNYPYGDTVFYTDGQPIFNWLLQFLNEMGIDVPVYGVLNYLLFFNVLLSTILVFVLLYKNKVSGWLCMIGALSITLASPQLWRIHYGHYALTYSSILLCFIYLILIKNPRKGIVGLFLVLASLIHIYYFLILGGWLVCYLSINWFTNKKSSEFLSKILFDLILPGLIIFVLMKSTDEISDRPDIPFGFFWFNSTISGVFFPNDLSIVEWFSNNVFRIKTPSTYEGYAYIGLLPFLYVVFSLFKLVRERFKFEFNNCSPLIVLLLASIPLLLFSFGWPFTLVPKGELYLEYVGLVKQFRAIGRFTWPFYYMIGLASVLWLFQFVKKEKAFYVLLLCLVSNLIYTTHTYISGNHATRNLRETNDVRLLKQFSDKNDDLKRYQAILSLPIYTGDLEIYYRNIVPIENTLELSEYTGVPVLSNFLPRTSFDQANAYLDIVYGQPSSEFLSRINDKPFLVIRDKGVSLSENEKLLLKKSKILFETDNLVIAEMNTEALRVLCAQKPSYVNAKELLNKKNENVEYSNSDEVEVLECDLTNTVGDLSLIHI